MYEAREQEDILAELQGYSTLPSSKVEGTFENDLLASNSIEFAKMEVELEEAYKAFFVETSSGEYLDLLGDQFGVTRRAAVAATGEVQVTGTGTVPAGSFFQTASGVVFKTTAAATVTSTDDNTIPVVCNVPGAQGNTAENTIIRIPVSIPGISAVTNAEATTGGTDEEDDDTYRERILSKVREPATSGNCNDYIEWATSVSGVGHVTVVPLWNGNGTVKVIVTDTDGNPASSDIIANVTAKIADLHPIGADVTVVAPSVLGLTIALTPTKGTGDADAIKKVINAYFLSRSYTDKKVSYAKIGQLIIDNSDTTLVEDYDDLTINGATANIVIDTEQIPSVVEVTLNG